MTWATIHDVTDAVVGVEPFDIEAADRQARAQVRAIGVDPDSVADPEGVALLRDLVVALAVGLVAARGVADGDVVLESKAREYGERAKTLTKLLSRESLGLAAVGSGEAGYGSIPVGRG